MIDVREQLHVGDNVLLVRAINEGDSPNPAAFFILEA